MKVIISIVLSLGIFFTAVWWNQKVINTGSDELLNQTLKLQKAIYDEDWELVQRETEEIKRIWIRHKKNWLILLDHQEVDEIDLRIYNIEQTVKDKEKKDILENITELRFHVQDAADKEELELANIF